MRAALQFVLGPPKLNHQLLKNGGFDSADAWALQQLAAISGGLCTLVNPSATPAATQNVVLTPGGVYQASYDIVGYVSGAARMRFLGGTTVSDVNRTANGTWTATLVAVTGNNQLQLVGLLPPVSLSIDNVSLKRIA